jgi:ribosome-binding protein aMBF1 (putative translation factor)
MEACQQCNGTGKIFLRNNSFIECDMCQGYGQTESNVLWGVIGNLIKEARMTKGLTLRKAAIKFNVDPSNLSRYERGIARPNPEYVRQIL